MKPINRYGKRKWWVLVLKSMQENVLTNVSLHKYSLHTYGIHVQCTCTCKSKKELPWIVQRCDCSHFNSYPIPINLPFQPPPPPPCAISHSQDHIFVPVQFSVHDSHMHVNKGLTCQPFLLSSPSVPSPVVFFAGALLCCRDGQPRLWTVADPGHTHSPVPHNGIPHSFQHVYTMYMYCM